MESQGNTGEVLDVTGLMVGETHGPFAAAYWSAMSLVGFLAALFATLGIVTTVAAGLGMDHLSQMVAWPIVWSVLSVAGVLLAARLAFGEWLRVSPGSVVVAATGIGLAAGVHYVLQQWELFRFGVTEPEYVGISAALFAVLVGTSVAAFAVLVAPRAAAVWPFPGVVVGAALTVLIVLSNVPGLQDGIEIDSWWLAICIGASGFYAIGVLLVTARHLLQSSPVGRVQ